jgi:aquaporin Z
MNVSMEKVWLAEFIGTFCLVFFGCGSIIAAEKGFLSPSYAAWIFGLTVFMMIVFFGKISNAHFNPARTLDLSTTKV